MWTNDENVALEQMVNRHTLREVLNTLAGICDEKAQHIQASYSDGALAAQWEKAAIVLYNACERPAVARVSRSVARVSR